MQGASLLLGAKLHPELHSRHQYLNTTLSIYLYWYSRSSEYKEICWGRRTSLKYQSGAGLIEALVAILVLSIGLLGMLGMQTAALKYEQTS